MDLAALLGVPRTGAAPSAAQVLDGLADGPYGSGACAPPPHETVPFWVRVDAVPPPADGVPAPFERLIATLGAGARLHVLITHEDDRGLALHVGVDGRDDLALVRSCLAPACDLSVLTAAPALLGSIAVGVVHRLLPEVSSAPGTAAATPLLERLALQPGAWSVLVVLEGAHQRVVQHAEQHLVDVAGTAAENLSTTQQATATRSVTTVSAGWSRVQEWLAVLHGHLAQGRASGAWTSTCWVTAEDDRCVARLLGCLSGALVEDRGRRFLTLDLDVDPRRTTPSPTSVLTSADVAGLLASPTASSPGLAVRKAPPAHRRPDRSAERLMLGTYWSTDTEAAIGLGDLEGHVFVTGTTGAGKTTTLHRLLAELWNENGVPFLVVDPVKDEYSDAAALFRGGITVVTGLQLCMNLMQPWPGEDPVAHVSHVSQAFRGAFTMPSPTPYVVTQLFDAVAMQPGGPLGTELYDVRDRLESLVAGLGYAPEAHSNILASLTTRLAILLAPVRAHRFAWHDSSMVTRLFTEPSVVTLGDLVDDEERSFVVLLLALATQAVARARRAPRPVEHVLVLEEAHRVIPETGPVVDDGTSGSAGRVSAALLSSLLAEVRSLGEQVVVVDQSPAKVDSDVLRNTNAKIAHRVVHPEDQASLAGALGLPPKDADLLGALARGQAIVSTRREPSPQTVQVVPARPFVPAGRARTADAGPTRWPCCRERARAHFRAWRAAPSAEPAAALLVAGARVGEGDGAALRKKAWALLSRTAAADDLEAQCLTWAALRRVLSAERAEALLPDAAMVEVSLRALFELWRDGVPVTASAAGDYGVPVPGRRGCPSCGHRCTLAHPARVLLHESPRTGLASLAGPAWRQDLGDVSSALSTELADLEVLLGPEGAKTLLRCQVHQAVARSRLPAEVRDKLLVRAGIS